MAPDLIVWCYCLNDNHKFLHKLDSEGHFLWTDEAKESLKIDSFVDKIISRSYVLSMIKMHWMAIKAASAKSVFSWEGTIDFNIAWKDYSWLDYEADLKEMKSTLDKVNCKLCVVVFPYGPQLNSRLMMINRDYTLKPQRKLGNLCKKYHIPLLDLFSSFYSLSKEHKRMLRDDIHLTKKGHEIVAQEIMKFLSISSFLSF